MRKKDATWHLQVTYIAWLVAFHAWKVVEPRPKPASESNSTHGKQGYKVGYNAPTGLVAEPDIFRILSSNKRNEATKCSKRAHSHFEFFRLLHAKFLLVIGQRESSPRLEGGEGDEP